MYTMEHYSALMKKKIMLFVGKWIELEVIMLSEITRRINIMCFLSYVEKQTKKYRPPENSRENTDKG
jgi:hypothetical protein